MCGLENKTDKIFAITMPIQFIKPEIVADENRPVSLENKEFPYFLLSDHRRFEELIFTIYNNEITSGLWRNLYEDINLLQGVKERGRDCTLHKEGNVKGVIQCKHSTNKQRISRSDCAKEIIKFILYSVQDARLIGDIKDFTYYFAVSSGFSEQAKDLLDNFNNEISNEGKLDFWIKNIINSNKSSLNSISFERDKSAVYSLLRNIKVKTIIPQELDILLSKSYNKTIIPLFFKIRSVVETEIVVKKLEELEGQIKNQQEYNHKSNIPIQKIIEKFEIASFHLTEYKSEFEKIPNSHIKRDETVQLLNWITSPINPNENPIAILAGNAGVGKSVILKDLFIKLKELQIPVLGLKADKLYAESIVDLEMNKIALESGIDKIINTLQEEYEKTVIIIDQLDALSQSLSAKREYLNTYNQFIQKLLKIKGVRIVVSVRLYDLNYDTDLAYYKNQKVFQIKKLNSDQIDKVISKLGLVSNKLPGRLQELLKVPNNLNVFCQVYTANIKLLSIKTLHDLYNLYWKQKIIKEPKKSDIQLTNCSKVVYLIAETMNQEQQISISSNLFIDNYFDEIEYLKSNEIIIEKKGEIQFFHQTFYDYAFAKQFVENKKSIIDHIKKNNQGLLIRSSIKMIMSFLREKNEEQYLKLLKYFLISKRIKFHIKLLLVSTLGFETNPTSGEKNLVDKLILKNTKLSTLFLESLYSKEWLIYIYEKGIINNQVNHKKRFFLKLNIIDRTEDRKHAREDNLNLVFGIFRRQLPDERKLVLDIVDKLPDFEEKPRFVFRILYFVNIWDCSKSFELFEKYQSESKKDKFGFYKILEDATSSNIDWVLKVYNPLISNKIESLNAYKDKLKFEHEDEELLEKLFEADRKKAFNFYLSTVKKIIKKTLGDRHSIKGYYIDLAFWLFNYNSDHHVYNYETILHKLIDEIKLFSKEESQLFKDYILKYRNSKSQTLLILLIYGFIANPTAYFQCIFTFLLNFLKKNQFQYDSKLNYYVRQLINSSYQYFTQEQKDIINTQILSIRVKWENEVYIDKKTNKKIFRKSFGYNLFKYLKAIPEDELFKQQELRRKYLELSRKPFALKYKDEEPNKMGGVSWGVPAPLPTKAYQKMDFDSWEISFMKYTEDRIYWNGGEAYGSVLEHSRTFKKEVMARPEYFYPFIEKLIEENKVPHNYLIKGIEGLKEGKYIPSKVLNIVKQMFKLSLNRENTLYLIWCMDYFIENRNTDKDLIDYLVYQSLNSSDPEKDKINGGIQQGINSVRGAAIQRLCQCSYNKEFHKTIFSTLFAAVDDKCSCVRATIMRALVYFLNIDRKKTLEVFLQLIKRNEKEVYAVSIETVQYLSYHFFDKLEQYFGNSIQVEDIRDNVAVILAVRWLENKKKSKKLLDAALKKSNKAKARMVEVAVANYKSENKKMIRKCNYLFSYFLNNTSDEVSHAYAHEILRLSPDKFEKLYPLLNKYANSKVAIKSPHNFFEYLQKCSKKYPVKSLKLIIKQGNYKRQNISADYINDDAIKALLGCYNSLMKDPDKNKKYIRKSIIVFDSMLQNSYYRISSNRVLEHIDN